MKLIAIAAKYLKKHPALAGLALVFIVLVSFFDGASLGMLIPLMQSMINNSSNLFEKIPFMSHLVVNFSTMDQVKQISFIFLLLFLIILFKDIFMYFSNILIEKLRLGAIRDLRSNLMSNLLEYDIGFFDSVQMGSIITNISNETLRMGSFINSVLRFVALLGRVIVYMIILFLISWKLSIIFFILIASVLIPIELIVRKLEWLGMLLSKATDDYNYKLTEILSGIRLIKICGSEHLEKMNFKNKTEKLYDSQYNSAKCRHLIVPLSEVFIFALITICFLAFMRITKINITNAFPFIAAYLLILARMLTQLNTLNSLRSAATNELAAFINYEKMYDKKTKKTIKTGNKEIKNLSTLIDFQNVNFSYIKDKKVLKDINIKIPKGKMTALVGASGAGKSTIVNLIPRFYDLESGKILVDGINLKDLALEKWRHKIGFISQDVFLFNMSVKDNISYGQSGIFEEEIVKAAKAANAHDFIMELSDGYDTIIGERGVKLSGGQKQRISIARAIMHNPEILILDEATSSLDTQTEKLITEAMDRLTKNRTVIAIAHRLSTILHANNIIVLDKGRIVEEGSHTDLIKGNGLYKRLYEAQFNLKDESLLEVCDKTI